MSAQLLMNQKPFIQLQIEELVEENTIKSTQIEKFFDKLKQIILSLGKSQENLAEVTGKKLTLPLIERPNAFDADYPKAFKFLPPEYVRLVGSIKTNTAIKDKTCIDIAVCMPSKCFEKKDIKNQRYHRKRALYLAQLADLLDSKIAKSLIDKLEFKYHQGDTLKPVLIILPRNGRLRRIANFQLFIVVDPKECPIKTSNLVPGHGNLAPKWFFQHYLNNGGKSLDEDVQKFFSSDSEDSISPFYNSSILADLELISNSECLSDQITGQSSITEAIVLAKIWLIRIGLQKHFSFIVTMLVANLHTRQVIHQNMSSFQIFKQIIKVLATQADWSKEGFAYYEDSSDRIVEFRKYFPVVFLSPSGCLNLCYNITSDLYQGLRHEAIIADKLLADPTTEIIDVLLLKKRDFFNKFDVIVHLPKCTQKIPKSIDILQKYMDHGILTNHVYSESIMKLLRTGLTDRVVLLQQSPEHLSLHKKRWNIKSIPHDPSNDGNTFTFGMLLNGENSLRIIDIGPAANSAEAEEFRKFWEPKSQLRLQDGQISETVVWHVSSISQCREIIKFIMIHTLKKLNINQITVLSTFLEKLISLNNLQILKQNNVDENQVENRTQGKGCKKRTLEPTEYESKPLGLGEVNYQIILKSYNDLNKLLRNLEDMKYSITSIQSISAHIRSTSEFPPLQVNFQPKNKALKRKKGATLFPKDFSQAGKVLHIDPIEILVTLESSGKWPNELVALEAAKQAYLIQMMEALRAKSYTVKLSDAGSYLDILYGQFVYRICPKAPKETSLVSQALGKEEYQKRRLQLDIAPRIHEALNQLARERVAFGMTCRVVKRWLSCQLLTDHLSDLTIELIVASLFISPEPYTEPASSSCGFRRFLELIARHDWVNSPLIVNFDNQFKMDQVTKLKDSMSEERDKFGPMVLCTPYDKDVNPWTRSNPSKETLELLVRICSKAYVYFNDEVLLKPILYDEYKALFRPNFKVFHLLIKLRYENVQNFFMSFDAPKDFVLRAKESNEKKPSAFAVMPIVGLNLVERYVELLRQEFDHLAWFFYDKYGQRLIGVVMRPDSEEKLGGDMDKFVKDLKKLGGKLVASISIVKKQENVDDDNDLIRMP